MRASIVAQEAPQVAGVLPSGRGIGDGELAAAVAVPAHGRPATPLDALDRRGVSLRRIQKYTIALSHDALLYYFRKKNMIF